jgi:FkbM family methyltransferase
MENTPSLDDLRAIHDLAYKEFIIDNMHKYERADFDGKQVLDVGGHVGFVTLLALHHGARKVVAIEANPVNHEKMRANLAPWPRATSVLCAAFDGVTRSVNILDGDGSGGGVSKVVPGTDVQAKSLAELVSYLDPMDDDMTLKMDTEGGEYDIMLCVSGEVIRRFSTVFLECHQVPHLSAHPARRCAYLRTYMEFLGYELQNEEPVCWWPNGPDGAPSGQCEILDDMRAMRFKRVSPR